MRNASMIGQALPPIEFPYSQISCWPAWSAEFPDYALRMRVISTITKDELEAMIEHDNAAEHNNVSK